MDQYEHIRTAHRVYGQSISEIARITGHSRNTIRKVLSETYDGYSLRQHQPFPVLGPFQKIIDAWLSDDRERPRKQRHTARRILDRLVAEHAFAGSESNVRNYVREVKERLGVSTTKAFLPLEPDLGQEDEVDWGTAMVVLQGQALKVKLAQNGPDNEPVEIATLIVPAASAPSFVNGLANALGQLEEQIKAKQGEMAEAVDGATNPN